LAKMAAPASQKMQGFGQAMASPRCLEARVYSRNGNPISMNTHHEPDLDRTLRVSLADENAAGFRHAPSPLPGSIVCGTNFSDASAQAVEVAAAIAKRVHEPLILVHAVNEPLQKKLPGELRESLALYARARYHDERERVRALDVEMIEAFSVGAPAAVLLQQAVTNQAQLIVLAASGERQPSHSPHGDVVEQVAEAAEMPSLIVRNATPLLRWIRGERRLRILVGADFSAPSDTALHWINAFRGIALCDLVVVYLDRNLTAYLGRDLNAATLMDEFVLGIARKQDRAFRRHVRALLGTSHVRVRFEYGWGHSDAHLIKIAAEERADLVVVGTHSRRGWHRLGHHSVSRGVLRYAPLNVVCVPVQTSVPLPATSEPPVATPIP
jgi:nucleotide-binding universal stress UspA family protein